MIINKTVVISCAGIGSRMGKSMPKALIEIDGKSIIGRLLEGLQEVQDVRIVVGYMAETVMKEATRYRNDVIFIYNNNYLKNKTGASFCMGARRAREYVIEIDGDLLIHPDDLKYILNQEGEWVCFSEISSNEAVLVDVTENDVVRGFSRKKGNYEWTGPVCLKLNNIHDTEGHVYQIIEPLLPLRGIKVRAYDVDTPDDFIRVNNIVRKWGES